MIGVLVWILVFSPILNGFLHPRSLQRTKVVRFARARLIDKELAVEKTVALIPSFNLTIHEDSSLPWRLYVDNIESLCEHASELAMLELDKNLSVSHDKKIFALKHQLVCAQAYYSKQISAMSQRSVIRNYRFCFCSLFFNFLEFCWSSYLMWFVLSLRKAINAILILHRWLWTSTIETI